MIRFDDKAKTLTLSVRDLAMDEDYRFSGPSPLSLKRRALLGRIEHEVHQESREEEHSSYRRERSIRYETRLGGWKAVVIGRIDGVYSDADGRTVIEEVKTVVGPPAEIDRATPETFPGYTRQLQLYRYLLEEGSEGLGFGDQAPEIALHLCLIALPSRYRRTVHPDYERDACRSLVERRLLELIESRAEAVARAERRREAAERIRFPHDALRPHQEDMVAAIETTLAEGRPILVSAPPGIGKTAGALVPAMRFAASRGGRVFVATSKTTQQAIFARTAALIRERMAPARLGTVVLQAREKSCLNDVVDCREEACRYALDYRHKLASSGALTRLLEAPVADPGTVKREAEQHEFCPFEASLDLVDEADVIVGDFNYAFDPGAALKRVFVEGDPSDVVLVVDEAHNLYERARDYYSPALRGDVLREHERTLSRRVDPISRRVLGLLRRLLNHLAAIDQGRARAPEPEPAAAAPEPAAPANMRLFEDPEAEAQEADERRRRSARLKKAASSTERLRTLPETEPQDGGSAGPEASSDPAPPPGAPVMDLPAEREVAVDREFFFALRDELNELSVEWFAEGRRGQAAAGPLREEPVVALNRALTRFAGVLELEGEEFTTIWRRADGGRLKILCKDPSRQLAKRIKACAGVVFVSATLEPLEFYRDVLGAGPEAALFAFPSPFDKRKRKVLVLDRPSTAYHSRERDLPIVEDAVRAALAAHPGNTLLCSPSFDYLERLARRLDDVPGYELIRQERSMSEARRREVLERLGESARGEAPPVALLVVQGGIFTEGVDYPGRLCEAALVIGPGLPRVSFERELIQSYFEQRYGRGFDYAFLFPGMNKVIQSAGRVIRTPDDKGAVVLVGSRFATARYSKLLPQDWYERAPNELVSQDPYGDLLAFWGQPLP